MISLLEETGYGKINAVFGWRRMERKEREGENVITPLLVWEF